MPRRCPPLSLASLFLSVVLSEALLRFCHHHRHHTVVLPEDSSYYFTIACWIEEVKASSSRTCVERVGDVRSALDREFVDGS
jgi:hypothetical protein